MNHSPDTDELMTMSLPNNIPGTTITAPPHEAPSSSSSPPPPSRPCSEHSSSTTENKNGSTTTTTIKKDSSSPNSTSSSPPLPNELEHGLRILENRINKIATPLAPSQLPKPTKSLLPKPDLKLKSNKSVKLMNIPSPISEIGPPSNGNNNNNNNALSSSATAPTTSSMLKSTLKRMTRLSKPSSSSNTPSNTHENHHATTSPKKRIAKSPAPPLGRSKSFKEPFSNRPSSSSSTSSTASNGSSSKTMSSSLRRPARRDDSNNIQRSGTSGNLAKRSQSMRRIRDRDICVKKSRGVQTQLTKDVMDEEVSCADESIPTAVDFTIYLPDILGCGNSVDPVETIVSEHTDPPDVRKNRQLTLDNMKLHREVERLKAQVNENEHLKKELKSVRIKLEEEVKARVNIEKQLDEHNDRVQNIVRSMDTVEREFECRQDNMLQLEQRCAEMQSQLIESQRTINEKRQELNRKCNDYKALLSRFQEAEMETTELQEFLQAEKTTLSEALKESETDILEIKQRFIEKERELANAEERCQHLVRLGEQRHQEILTLEAQLNGVQEKAKEMILSQGAEISRASIAFSQLSAKLEAFFNNFSNNNHFNHHPLSHSQGFKTPGFPHQGSSFDDDENSSSSSNLSSPLRKNSVSIPRSASHFLVTPPNKDFEDDEELVASFNRAMMTVSLLGPSGTGSSNSINNNQCLSNNNICNINNNNNNNNDFNNTSDPNETNNATTVVNTSLQNLSNAIDTRKKSQETGGLSENSDISTSSSSLPSLVDRICDITNLIDKYNLNLRNISNCNCDRSTEIKELDSLGTSTTTADVINENQTNGNDNNKDLSKILLEKENEINELKKTSERMLKHREILQSNWKNTEAEVHEMDNLYQVTVENVLNVLRSHPDIVNANREFLCLQKKMESVADNSSSSSAATKDSGGGGQERGEEKGEDNDGLRSGGGDGDSFPSQALKKQNGGLSNVKSSLTLHPEEDLNANQSL